MSEIFDDGDAADLVPPRPSGRLRALVITIAVVILGAILFTTFASIFTDRLWYQSVGYGEVFGTLFWTKTVLFIIFGVLMALIIGINVYLAFRYRPLFRPNSPEQNNLDRYREAVMPFRVWLLIGISVALGLFAGSSGAGQWRHYLMWRNGVDFGTKDPYFGRDIGFFVFDLPWFHYLIDYTMAVTVIALLVAAGVHYLYGGIRLQTPGDRLSGAAQAQLSALLGVFVLAKSVDYYLDRFDLATHSGSLLTGMNYTGDHAVLPAKNILLGITVICAVLFFVNIWRRTWLLPSVGLALLVVSAILLGLIWPGIVQQFQVKPTEADKELPFIAKNIAATRDAYDIAEVVPQDYAGSSATQLTSSNLEDQVDSVPLVDPLRVQRAFDQIQQARVYYSVPPVLDVDHYPIDGNDRALVLGARELNQDDINSADKNWSNLHTVYTHGSGIIAAFANQRNAADQVIASTDAQWAEGIGPGEDALTQSADGYENRIYYGEQSPPFSIVGKQPGGPDVELDLSTSSSSADGTSEDDTSLDAKTTYDGAGGVGIGSTFRKLLFALKFGDSNLLLSGRVNTDSKILYNRNPRDAVAKVAPWLTLDSDAYPVVVDHRIQWVIDGYTTTDEYPGSESESFQKMIDDSLQDQSGVRTLPTDEINYMRNAVKATVDAYDGTVTLYAWDETDPILQTWEKVFPGVVRPKSSIPVELQAHLRYPEDLFKVQRYQYARYHITDAGDWYQGNNRWEVPEDPNVPGHLQPPYRLFAQDQAGNEPWSLTSVFVPFGKSNLASFVSVNSDATSEDYGKFEVLELQNQVDGPGQVANLFSNNDEVRAQLFKFQSGQSPPIFGNLLTLPVRDDLIYIEPLYALRAGTSSGFPTLQYVLVSYRGEVGIGTTLTGALANVLTGQTDTGVPDQNPGDGGNGNGNGGVSATVESLLQRAQAAFQAADAALKKTPPDLALYGEKITEARQLVQRAIDIADANGTAPSSPASPSASTSATAGTPSETPTSSTSEAPAG